MSDTEQGVLHVAMNMLWCFEQPSNAEYGCWADYCDGAPEWRIEPIEGGTVYLACGDAEDVFQAIATMVAHGAAQVVVQAWQPPADPAAQPSPAAATCVHGECGPHQWPNPVAGVFCAGPDVRSGS